MDSIIKQISISNWITNSLTSHKTGIKCKRIESGDTPTPCRSDYIYIFSYINVIIRLPDSQYFYIHVYFTHRYVVTRYVLDFNAGASHNR